MAERTHFYVDVDDVYGGAALGRPYRDLLAEGVVAGSLSDTALKVSQRGAGANLSVDVAAGSAFVLGDTDPVFQPLYRVTNDAVVNLGITPDPSNPRKVVVVALVRDATFSGVNRDWQLQAIHGTPSGSPAEPAVPDSALKLAVVDVAAAATQVVNADITDSRVLYGLNADLGAGSGGGNYVPIDLRNPQTGANAGNCFPTVTGLTAWEEWHWEFAKDVDGKLYGVFKVPESVTPTAQKIVLDLLWNATTGVARVSVKAKNVADGSSLNPASLTAATSQDVAVPGTARLRKRVEFVIGTDVWAAGDTVLVEVFHEGAHANDTVAVNTELVGAYAKLA